MALLAGGVGASEAARRTDASLSTVKRWRREGLPTRRRHEPVPGTWRPPDAPAYAYLLGVYLGDGCLSLGWGPPQLHITLDSRYRSIVDEVARAIEAMAPEIRVHHRTHREGMVILQAWSHVWLRAFPQHGPGKKHQRRIELVSWQRAITHAHPRELLRGLIHSDGCRTINRFCVDLPRGGRRTYEYARYFFSNLSGDIRGIFTEHCDLIGIRWTLSNPRNVSVSHRPSVVALDEFVGPKA